MNRKRTIDVIQRMSRILLKFSVVFFLVFSIFIIVLSTNFGRNIFGIQEIVIAIPFGEIIQNEVRLYPISILVDGKYFEIKTSFDNNETEVLTENNKAISIINRNKKFNVFSNYRKIGVFTTDRIASGQGLSCDYTFSPVGKMQIESSGEIDNERMSIFITKNDKTKTFQSNEDVNENTKNKIIDSIAILFQTFNLKIDKISCEYIKKIFLDDNTELFISMTNTKLTNYQTFYESSGETDEFYSLSILHLRNGTVSNLYLKNPTKVLFTEFIWAGDIEGDGNIEIILREAYGEFGCFVIYRLNNDELIKIFEGTEYGC